MMNWVLQVVAAWILRMIPNDQLYHPALFDALLRHGWYTAFEAVLLHRTKSGAIEIYLQRRGSNETFPGQWHVPGTLLYKNDMSDANQATRLGKKEFGAIITSYRMVGKYDNPDEGRGKCVHNIYLIELGRRPPTGNGEWWPVDALPANTIHFHRDSIIPIALKAFKKE